MVLNIQPYKTLPSFEVRKRGSAFTGGSSSIYMYLYVSVLVNLKKKKVEKIFNIRNFKEDFS